MANRERSKNSPGVGFYNPEPSLILKKYPRVVLSKDKRFASTERIHNAYKNMYFFIWYRPISYIGIVNLLSRRGGDIGKEDRFTYRKATYSKEEEETPGPWHYSLNGQYKKYRKSNKSTFGFSRKFHQYERFSNAPGPASYNLNNDPRITKKEFSIPKVYLFLYYLDSKDISWGKEWTKSKFLHSSQFWPIQEKNSYIKIPKRSSNSWL